MIWTVLCIIALTGSVGGVANYLINAKAEKKPYEFLRAVIVGIVAAAVVPLFLQTVSSGLLKGAVNDPLSYFVFAGFCLLAAVSSSKFIQSLTERVLHELEEVKQANLESREKIEAVVSQYSDDKPHEILYAAPLKHVDSPETASLLTALQNSTYPFKTAAVLAQAIESDVASVTQTLQQLRAERRVRSIKRLDGTTVWF